ncbi:MAG: DUF2330 domain-containing protein [Myxococcales bacterium]|nr:DUF2330 domain-containing protein [Myxococcales bacterium]
MTIAARPLPRLVAALALAGLTTLTPQRADAFCGFYVSGADAKLLNNATSVVLMRDGTRTVLSMQNNYQGPPQNFAMVVPVPVVLQEPDVKVLPREIFDRVDQLAAPRLVEYWEQDPCWQEPEYDYDDAEMAPMAADEGGGGFRERSARDLGIKIEAEFAVGEYEIVILSARDSLGLDTWLRLNRYSIPAGAEEVLRPYVHSGMKFFVAKVNVAKVRFEGGQAMLSPLRFHYDSKNFSLPVRLGLLNSGGAQDLIVHILSREVRYQVANYRNVAIPTNIEVADATRARFGEFYAALFDRVLQLNPGSVVTEYAWAAGSCDPCPIEPLSLGELATLGADVLPTYQRAFSGRVPSELEYQVPNEFVLTRLHARYSRESLGEDLVFQAAVPITGGREVMGADGQVERGATESSYNNFQARYVIRHRWQGPIECENPVYERWGGPPPGVQGGGGPAVARDLAFVARDAPLESFMAEAVPAIGTPNSGVLAKKQVNPPFPGNSGASGGCASCRLDQDARAPGVAFGLAALGLVYWRRRRRCAS